MGIKKLFLLLMITIMPVAYVSGIVIFDIAAECISENSDLKKDQVQSEEENNPVTGEIASKRGCCSC